MLGSRSLQAHSGLLDPLGWDRELERWVVHHRADWLNPVFVGLSYIGSFGLVWIAIAAVCLLLWRRPLVLIAVLAAVVVADLSALGIRRAVGRPRPFRRYPEPDPLGHVPHDSSFPSGHTTIAFAAATVLAYYRPRWSPAFFLLAVAIGFSRIYDGVHYPLDVLGGALLGVLVGAVVIVLLRLEASRRR
jgi:undecaprenyl-diphosphatase